MHRKFNELLEANKQWAENQHALQPDLFNEMAAGQHPTYLWIGCADSRVPAQQITGSSPGSLFVQRNVANMVVHTDYNLLSVVNYAIKALKVQHIIVCGHYGCGGIKAAMGNKSYGLLDNWVAHIKDVYCHNQAEIEAVEGEKERWDKFVEVNVREQVRNLARLSFVQEEWKEGEFPYIHGWVFDIENGLLKNLDLTINSTDSLDAVYRFQ